MGKKDNAVHSFGELVGIMAHLRDPVKGCPWDREQTIPSLRQYVLEEAYEVVEAIDKGDLGSLKEELGDLLLQVVFQARLAEEDGAFDINDVIKGIHSKLIERHPHVFGDIKVKGSSEVVENWEEIKKNSRGPSSSAIDGVPKTMPALLQAHRVSEKAARVGFDWPDLAGIQNKVDEELGELKDAIESETNGHSHIREELGDLLFAMVNLARLLKINPEDALREATYKFIDRFKKMERALRQKGKSVERTDMPELNQIWEKIK